MPGAARPRPSAAIVLVRASEAGDEPGPELFMVRRDPRAAFAGGAHVFPGGTLIAEDHDAELAARCVGHGDAEASVTLGLSSGGLAYWIAAVRECFEEAGVLLASLRSTGQPVDSSDAAAEAALGAYRRALAAGQIDFKAILRREDLVLDLSRIYYIAHWITPPDVPRRYDTRFFLAAAPAGQRAMHDERETIAGLWIRPDEALARDAAGAFHVVVPTRRLLEDLARFSRTDDLLEAARTAARVPTVEPVIWSDEARDHAATGLLRKQSR